MDKNGKDQHRLEALLRDFSVERPMALGLPHKPRRSTDPAVDDAAWEVARCILGEPGQDREGLLRLYVVRIPVKSNGRRPTGPHERATKIAHEWNARRIINDRLWDWLRHQANSKDGKDSRLGPGRTTIDLYYRCNSACAASHDDLLQPLAKTQTAHRLTGCPTSGVIHLCRASIYSCHCLEQTHDTELVCRESSRVCSQAGVAVVWEGNIDWARQARSFVFDLGRRRFDASDPENARRAQAVEAMQRGGCSHVVSWDPLEGELTLDMTIPHYPQQQQQQQGDADADDPEDASCRKATDGGLPFDPTFLWRALPHPGDKPLSQVLAPVAGPSTTVRRTTTSAPPTPAPPHPKTGPLAPRALSALPWHRGMMVAHTSALRSQNQRSMRSRLLRQSSARRALTNSSGGRLSGSLEDRERAAVERVLDDLLWDAGTRRVVNAQALVSARGSAQAALYGRIDGPAAKAEARIRKPGGRRRRGPPLISALFMDLASQSHTEATDDPEEEEEEAQGPPRGADECTRVLSVSQVQQTVLASMCATLVPVAPLDSDRHSALTTAILYLWSFVLHEPPESAAKDGGDESDPCSPSRTGGEEPGSAPMGVDQPVGLPQQPRKRRDTNGRVATLTQFALGFLYTAAVSGIDVGNRRGWPRDWWLHEHLPAIKSVGLYGKGTRRVGSIGRLEPAARADERGSGDRATAALVLSEQRTPTTADSRRQRDYQQGRRPGVYQTTDITAGKRALSLAVRDYAGKVPSPQEAATFLRKAYARAHSGPKGAPAARDQGPRLSPVRARTTTASRRQQHQQRHKRSLSGKAENNGGVQPRSSKKQKKEPKAAAAAGRVTVTMQSTGAGFAPRRGTFRFCCLFTSEPAGRAHLCIMFNPWDPAGPPGLTAKVMRQEHWALDTVAGPFVHEPDARAFCLKSAQARCDGLSLRRVFVTQLAQQLGLQVWRQAGAAKRRPPSPPALPLLRKPGVSPKVLARRRALAARARAAQARDLFGMVPAASAAPMEQQPIRPVRQRAQRRNRRAGVNPILASLYGASPADLPAPTLSPLVPPPPPAAAAMEQHQQLLQPEAMVM